MIGPDAAATFARNLFSAFARLGVRHVVLSPGSRNAPLALAAEQDPVLRTTMVLDERSAGFVALGLAKSTRDPVVTVCTSGSAATHYHPAVVEARHARVPIVVITADRPPELRGTAAPQTIDQTALFGDAVKLFHDTGVPDEITARAADRLALRLFAASSDSPAGPVHLNVPLREPLLGEPVGEPPPVAEHVPGVTRLQPEGEARLASRLAGRTAIVVAGGRQRSGFGAAAALFGLETGIPIIADIQCRQPGPTLVSTGDLLFTTKFPERARPEIVLRLGGLPTSRAVWRWVDEGGVDQVWLDDGPWRDPLSTGADAYRADPTATLGAIAALVAAVPSAWTEEWAQAERRAGAAAAAAIEAEPFPNEPAVARIVASTATPGSIIYGGSSMPIRDLDSFAGPPRPIQVLANRGANGIDGLLSAAAGAALSGSRVFCLAGDVAAIHDLNALVTIATESLPVTIVVVNNDGGGIFHFLPQADPAAVDEKLFERLFAAPHGFSMVPIASAIGIPAQTVTDSTVLTEAIASPGTGPQLLEVVTDRRRNVAVHQRIRAAVAAAVE